MMKHLLIKEHFQKMNKVLGLSLFNYKFCFCNLVNREMVDTMMFRNSKNFMGDNAMEGLDELARVTVLNDNEPQDDVGGYLIQ